MKKDNTNQVYQKIIPKYKIKSGISYVLIWLQTKRLPNGQPFHEIKSCNYHPNIL